MEKVCCDEGTSFRLPRDLDSENSKILPSLSEEGGEMYRFDRMEDELEVEQSVDPSDLLRSASMMEFTRGRFAVPPENVAVNFRVELIVGKVFTVTTAAGVYILVPDMKLAPVSRASGRRNAESSATSDAPSSSMKLDDAMTKFPFFARYEFFPRWRHLQHLLARGLSVKLAKHVKFLQPKMKGNNIMNIACEKRESLR